VQYASTWFAALQGALERVERASSKTTDRYIWKLFHSRSWDGSAVQQGCQTLPTLHLSQRPRPSRLFWAVLIFVALRHEEQAPRRQLLPRGSENSTLISALPVYPAPKPSSWTCHQTLPSTNLFILTTLITSHPTLTYQPYNKTQQKNNTPKQSPSSVTVFVIVGSLGRV
jgi:hypothetical protein